MSDTSTPAAPAAPEAASSAPADAATPLPATPSSGPDAAATPPPAAPEKPKEPPLSPRAAALMRQESDLRKREAGLKAQEAKWAEALKEREEHEGLKKKDVAAWLKAQGLSYEEITATMLNGGVVPPEKVRDERIAAAEAKAAEALARLDAREKEIAAKESAAQVADFWKGARAEVEAARDTFPLVLEHPDGWDTVQALVEKHAAETGEVLPAAEAAKRVQAALEAQLEPLLKSSWLRAKVAPAADASASAPKPASPPAASDSGPSRAARTLTNSQAAVVPTAPQRPTTRDERIALATAQLKAKK